MVKAAKQHENFNLHPRTLTSKVPQKGRLFGDLHAANAGGFLPH